jgi:hypothetical protein
MPALCCGYCTSVCCATLLNLRHLTTSCACISQSGTNQEGVMTPLKKGKTALEVVLLNQL